MKLSETQTQSAHRSSPASRALADRLPGQSQGGARLKVLTSLANANLIAAHSQAEDGTTQFAITDAGRSALGIAIKSRQHLETRGHSTGHADLIAPASGGGNARADGPSHRVATAHGQGCMAVA